MAIRRACPCPPSVHTPGQRDTNLITGLAARAQAFSMVATTVDLASMVEVDEVHQQLPARGAHKALWVPAGTQACTAGKHGDVPTSNLLPALPNDRWTPSPSPRWQDGWGSAKACHMWAFPVAFVTGPIQGVTLR